MKLYCDKKSTITIAHNPTQHDQTKHVEVDRHFIKEKLKSKLICTPCPNTWTIGKYFNKGIGKIFISKDYKQARNR